MKILNFGSCNLDYVYSLDHIVFAGETETADSLETFPGGKGLNQSIALARAGAKVYHAGCIGADGALLSDILKDNGVDVSNLRTVEGKSGHAIIQVSADGENSIVVYRGANEKITEEFIDSVLSKFSSGDVLLLQNEINGIDLIIEKAHKMGMRIVFNPSPCDKRLKSVRLDRVEYLVVNAIEAEMLSGVSDKELILNYFADNYPKLKVVLTLGKKGSVFNFCGVRVFQSAFVAETVDTTAAGDTFAGFFIAEISRGADEKTALKIASAASAIAVSKKGAAPSIPKIDDVKRRLDFMKERRCEKSMDCEIERYIEENLKSASVNELSEMLGYSVGYTQNLVKKLCGKPFSTLVREKCCAAAAELLKETDLPVGEIIKRVGYENESFFRRNFKKKYGLGMTEYRKRRG